MKILYSVYCKKKKIVIINVTGLNVESTFTHLE